MLYEAYMLYEVFYRIDSLESIAVIRNVGVWVTPPQNFYQF